MLFSQVSTMLLPTKIILVALYIEILRHVAFAIILTPSYLSDVTFGQSSDAKASCIHGTIAINVTATNLHFTIQPPSDQYAATEIVQELVEHNSSLVPSTSTGPVEVSGSYNISATLCYPKGYGPQIKTINILTSGIGFDKSYWDISPGNSYVEALVAAGYSTLAYDRLGTGSSQYPDGINVVQSTFEVEVLHALIQRIGSESRNVVCTRHSYGSVIQVGHSGKYPRDCTAVIETGISCAIQDLPYTILSTNPALANQAFPAKFSQLSNAYYVDPTPISLQQPFLRYPHFDISGTSLKIHGLNYIVDHDR